MEKAHKNIIVMGDFNGQVGKENIKDNFCIGKYSTGKKNNNGQRLLDFALQHKTIYNEYFFQKTI